MYIFRDHNSFDSLIYGTCAATQHKKLQYRYFPEVTPPSPFTNNVSDYVWFFCMTRSLIGAAEIWQLLRHTVHPWQLQCCDRLCDSLLFAWQPVWQVGWVWQPSVMTCKLHLFPPSGATPLSHHCSPTKPQTLSYKYRAVQRLQTLNTFGSALQIKSFLIKICFMSYIIIIICTPSIRLMIIILSKMEKLWERKWKKRNNCKRNNVNILGESSGVQL